MPHGEAQHPGIHGVYGLEDAALLAVLLVVFGVVGFGDRCFALFCPLFRQTDGHAIGRGRSVRRLFGTLDPARGQHGRQGKRHDQRDEDGERHRDAERVHEPPDDPLHERDGQEHGDERQRRGQHGQADLARSLDRRLERIHALFFDEAVDIFQHHDRVVNHDTDGKRQGQQGHAIERKVHGVHQRKRADDRGGNGDGRNDGRAPVPEEDQDDDRGKNAAQFEMLLHRIGRGLDVLGLVAGDADFVARRQPFFDVCQFLFQRVNRRHGVQARLLADGEQHGRNAVQQGRRVLVLHAVFHMPDIGNTNKRAAFFGDHDVVEVLRVFHAAMCAQRQFPRVLIHFAARNLDVLRLKRALHVNGRQVDAAQFVRCRE